MPESEGRVTNDRFVLASTFPPVLYGIFPTRAYAEAKAFEANASSAKHAPSDEQALRYEAMSMGEYREAERAYWLSRPLEEIEPAEFHKLLNGNVPIEWEFRDGVQRFSLPVPKQGSFYQHLAELNGRCFQRFCDIYDPKTFITAAEIAAHCAPEGQGHAARIEGEQLYQDAPEACR